ncbi:ribonuclease H-like YkuK family protein [Desulfotruncus alcoholivorax]|uniref:ribonuclease H-like YkuK family protein n=1 Tax=Desulfotruncus alcoholivorax TaxID=265477 RepID=UPI0004860E0E|nr:ribonuclease H-like YkuK family protein [Desulfotruncus alcoholivorax]
MVFISPSKGRLSFDKMMKDITEYIKGLPLSSYKIIIGTDSMVREETCFITAVVVHRLGKGARYYYRKIKHRKIKSIRQKVFYETALSLELGGQIAKFFSESGFAELQVEIHIDVGLQGETKSLIKEVVGMVTGSGFQAKIKPEAYGASSVADKHTK